MIELKRGNVIRQVDTEVHAKLLEARGFKRVSGEKVHPKSGGERNGSGNAKGTDSDGNNS